MGLKEPVSSAQTESLLREGEKEMEERGRYRHSYSTYYIVVRGTYRYIMYLIEERSY